MFLDGAGVPDTLLDLPSPQAAATSRRAAKAATPYAGCTVALK
jgi:hypothetical protein